MARGVFQLKMETPAPPVGSAIRIVSPMSNPTPTPARCSLLRGINLRANPAFIDDTPVSQHQSSPDLGRLPGTDTNTCPLGLRSNWPDGSLSCDAHDSLSCSAHHSAVHAGFRHQKHLNDGPPKTRQTRFVPSRSPYDENVRTDFEIRLMHRVSRIRCSTDFDWRATEILTMFSRKIGFTDVVYVPDQNVYGVLGGIRLPNLLIRSPTQTVLLPMIRL
jgi:hypothetical protein